MKLVMKINNLLSEKLDYVIDHPSFSSVISEVVKFVKSKGLEVDEDEMFNKVTTAGKRPKVGKTSRFTLGLNKNGKPSNSVIAFQVYGKDKSYELNMYISKGKWENLKESKIDKSKVQAAAKNAAKDIHGEPDMKIINSMISKALKIAKDTEDAIQIVINMMKSKKN